MHQGCNQVAYTAQAAAYGENGCSTDTLPESNQLYERHVRSALGT